MRRIALKLREKNVVIYDIGKTKAVLFSRARRQELTKLLETKLRIDRETIYFKKEAT